MEMNNSVYFELLRNFGLSLSDKKKYFVIYDNHTWTIHEIYDNLEKAITEGYENSMDEYYDICKKHNIDENYIGHNKYFYKGFLQNLNMWQLLHLLCEEINKDKKRHGLPVAKHLAVTYIDNDMYAYPEYIDKNISKFVKM